MSEAFTRAVEGLRGMFGDYLTEADLHQVVRKVLEAVREPDLAMRKVSTFEAAERDWPAMIDAILIQDPAIPVVGKLVMDADTATGEVRE